MAELRRRYKGTRFDHDRHGNPRWYTLDPKGRKVRMRETPGSDAWVAEWTRIRAGTHLQNYGPKPGSLGAMIRAWMASTEWEGYAKTTQATRRRVLNDMMWLAGDRAVGDITAKDVRAGRDSRKSTPAAANNRIKIISALYSWGIENDYAVHNPAKSVKRLPMRKGGFHTWTLVECLQFEARHPLGTQARVAYALGLYLSCRRQDIPALGPQHRGADNFMAIPRQKTRGPAEDGAAPQYVWIANQLAEALDAFDAKGLVYLMTEYGKPFSVDGLGNKMRDWCDEANLPQCSLHGLRKACVARMAAEGLSAKDMQAVSDHETIAELERYARDAAKKQASKRAIEKTFGEQNRPLSDAHHTEVGRKGKKDV